MTKRVNDSALLAPSVRVWVAGHAARYAERAFIVQITGVLAIASHTPNFVDTWVICAGARHASLQSAIYEYYFGLHSVTQVEKSDEINRPTGQTHIPDSAIKLDLQTQLGNIPLVPEPQIHSVSEYKLKEFIDEQPTHIVFSMF
ncbi:Hypothetical_protein [Hexamita inflata]|uniref:Hypothetical_protein n=1 Tax=Hexamita inflata TaxID=28002 RepID=A0AA86QEM2_9EUKA|nr:Hypothetical protein HINF_LOCUS25356 [Hexamita inflata]CAI9957841.1 Hypothetical protein HINF_LOCUS45486 [Hexamita inflata]